MTNVGGLERRSGRYWKVAAWLLATGATAVAGDANLKSFGGVQYLEPANFGPTPLNSPDHVSFRRVDPQSWIFVAIYQPRVVTKRLAEEFKFDWSDINRASGVAPPDSAERLVGANIPAREGGAYVPQVGFVDLVELDAGDRVVSVFIECGGQGQFLAYQDIINPFLASLVLLTAKENSGSTSAPPPAATARTTVRAEDLVGVWNIGSAKNITYALLKGGKYEGAWTHFSAEEYTFAADGSFNYRYRQTHPVFTDEYPGNWGLDGGLWLKGKGREKKSFQIVTYSEEADGRTVMKLLEAGVKVTEFNGGKEWVRESSERPSAPPPSSPAAGEGPAHKP